MKLALSLFIAIAVSAFQLAPQSMAQAPRSPATGANYTALKLTAADVDKFLKAFPDLTRQFKDVNFSQAASGSNAAGVMEGLKAKDKLEAFAKSKGYQDGASFANQCGAILLSYYVLKIDEARKQMAAESADLPAESKAMLELQFKKLDEQVAAQRKILSPETIAAVKARLPALEKLVNETQPAR